MFCGKWEDSKHRGRCKGLFCWQSRNPLSFFGRRRTDQKKGWQSRKTCKLNSWLVQWILECTWTKLGTGTGTWRWSTRWLGCKRCPTRAFWCLSCDLPSFLVCYLRWFRWRAGGHILQRTPPQRYRSRYSSGIRIVQRTSWGRCNYLAWH